MKQGFGLKTHEDRLVSKNGVDSETGIHRVGMKGQVCNVTRVESPGYLAKLRKQRPCHQSDLSSPSVLLVI